MVRSAGLLHCVAHGLKEAAATICAEVGTTDRQMMVPFDWSSEKPATAHTKNANPTGIAAAAGALFALRPLARLAEVPRQEQSAQNRHKLLILFIFLAGVEGLEPPTPGFGDRCSSH
jgi:hypothetical protein